MSRMPIISADQRWGRDVFQHGRAAVDADAFHIADRSHPFADILSVHRLTDPAQPLVKTAAAIVLVALAMGAIWGLEAATRGALGLADLVLAQVSAAPVLAAAQAFGAPILAMLVAVFLAGVLFDNAMGGSWRTALSGVPLVVKLLIALCGLAGLGVLAGLDMRVGQGALAGALWERPALMRTGAWLLTAIGPAALAYAFVLRDHRWQYCAVESAGGVTSIIASRDRTFVDDMRAILTKATHAGLSYPIAIDIDTGVLARMSEATAGPTPADRERPPRDTSISGERPASHTPPASDDRWRDPAQRPPEPVEAAGPPRGRRQAEPVMRREPPALAPPQRPSAPRDGTPPWDDEPAFTEPPARRSIRDVGWDDLREDRPASLGAERPGPDMAAPVPRPPRRDDPGLERTPEPRARREAPPPAVRQSAPYPDADGVRRRAPHADDAPAAAHRRRAGADRAVAERRPRRPEADMRAPEAPLWPEDARPRRESPTTRVPAVREPRHHREEPLFDPWAEPVAPPHRSASLDHYRDDRDAPQHRRGGPRSADPYRDGAPSAHHDRRRADAPRDAYRGYDAPTARPPRGDRAGSFVDHPHGYRGRNSDASPHAGGTSARADDHRASTPRGMPPTQARGASASGGLGARAVSAAQAEPLNGHTPAPVATAPTDAVRLNAATQKRALGDIHMLREVAGADLQSDPERSRAVDMALARLEALVEQPDGYLDVGRARALLNAVGEWLGPAAETHAIMDSVARALFR